MVTLLKLHSFFKIFARTAGKTLLQFIGHLFRFCLWIQCFWKALRHHKFFVCFFRWKWYSWVSYKIHSSECWLLPLSDSSEVLLWYSCLWDWMCGECRAGWCTAWISNSSLPDGDSGNSNCKFPLLLLTKLRFRILQNWILDQYC